MLDALTPISPEDPALLIYSSGSTGLPKGAVHTHRSVLAHGRNAARSHELTAADRSLLVLPLYHINAECVTLMPTLTSGGSVVVPHGFLVNEFWNWLDDYRCTWSAVVPTIISQLLDWQDPRARRKNGHVRAHPLPAHILGSIVTRTASRVCRQIQPGADPSDGVIRSRQCVLESLASAQEQDRFSRSCRGDSRQRLLAATAQKFRLANRAKSFSVATA